MTQDVQKVLFLSKQSIKEFDKLTTNVESLTNTVNVNSQSSEEIGKLVAENAASIAKLKDAMMGIQESLDGNEKWALHTSTRTTFVNQEVKTLKQSLTEHSTRFKDLEQVINL